MHMLEFFTMFQTLKPRKDNTSVSSQGINNISTPIMRISSDPQSHSHLQQTHLRASAGPDRPNHNSCFLQTPVRLVSGDSDGWLCTWLMEHFSFCTVDTFASQMNESYFTSIQGWVTEGRDVGNEALKYESISCRDYQSYLTGM